MVTIVTCLDNNSYGGQDQTLFLGVKLKVSATSAHNSNNPLMNAGLKGPL